MYTRHFGLTMLPFENVPDPRFFFDEGDHARIHGRIADSLEAGRGLIVVTGPVGSGKTTLSQMIISERSKGVNLIWMAEPPGNSTDLFLFIAQELGLKPASTERTFVLRDIRDALIGIAAEGSRCLVIIDESHLMTDDTLNGIRLLNNLEEGATKLIQILLLGQEELMKTVNRPDLENFKQRIATLEIMGKMNPERINRYISHRLEVAGGSPSIFAETGREALNRAFTAGSTPRLVNSLCDRSLTTACERGKTAVDVDDVYEAAKGMGLEKEIFFYVVALRKGEKQHQASSAQGIDTTSASVPEAEDRPRAPQKEPDISDKEHTLKPSRPSLAPREREVPGFFSYEREKKGLKVPSLFFVLSVAAFVFSLLFYCERSGGSDLVSCIRDLISF